MKAAGRAWGTGPARRGLIGLLAATVLAVGVFPADAAPKSPNGQADVSVGFWLPRYEMSDGQEATFEVDVHNVGPSTARSARLTITVSGPATLLDTWSGWSCIGASPMVCSFDEIPPDDFETARVRVRATGVGSFTMNAEVVAAERDPSTANNTASHTVEVAPGADVMALSTATGEPTPSITHTITNNGPADATGVRALIQAGGPMVAAASQGTCQVATSTWMWMCNLGVLTNGQIVIVQVAQVEPASATVEPETGAFDGPTGAHATYGPSYSTVDVTSTSSDPKPWNNQDGSGVAGSSAGAGIDLCWLPGLRSLPGVCWDPF